MKISKINPEIFEPLDCVIYPFGRKIWFLAIALPSLLIAATYFDGSFWLSLMAVFFYPLGYQWSTSQRWLAQGLHAAAPQWSRFLIVQCLWRGFKVCTLCLCLYFFSYWLLIAAYSTNLFREPVAKAAFAAIHSANCKMLVGDRSSKTLMERAQAYARIDKYALAISDLQTIIARNPNDVAARNLLTEIYIETVKLEKGKDVVVRTLEIAPNDARAMHLNVIVDQEIRLEKEGADSNFVIFGADYNPYLESMEEMVRIKSPKDRRKQLVDRSRWSILDDAFLGDRLYMPIIMYGALCLPLLPLLVAFLIFASKDFRITNRSAWLKTGVAMRSRFFQLLACSLLSCVMVGAGTSALINLLIYSDSPSIVAVVPLVVVWWTSWMIVRMVAWAVLPKHPAQVCPYIKER